MTDLSPQFILGWLNESNPQKLRELWSRADETRRRHVGDEVHLRGLIEISNWCARSCAYCGIRAKNPGVQRYRMTGDEIVSCTLKAAEFGYGTVVLQSGEDYGMTAEFISGTVKRIKKETGLAVTLSLGERPLEELAQFKAAGADRYLLRFETSDEGLYQRIHPPLPGRGADRVKMLLDARRLGFEIGSGFMVGIPGQSYESVVNDILLLQKLDMDMIGIGPYIPHPGTPLGNTARRPGQVPNDELMTLKVLAITRLACPDSNIPSTTALATIDKMHGREHGLRSGANIIMPNLTPLEYRTKYELYPDKACSNETAEETNKRLLETLKSLGRKVGKGHGGRRDRKTTL
jgi:biotin synthase